MQYTRCPQRILVPKQPAEALSLRSVLRTPPGYRLQDDLGSSARVGPKSNFQRGPHGAALLDMAAPDLCKHNACHRPAIYASLAFAQALRPELHGNGHVARSALCAMEIE
jgi:hypothetical protein